MKNYKYRKDITVNGKRYIIRANSARELAEKEVKKRIQIEKNEVVVAPSMTLSAWAEQCVETYKTNQKDITREKFVLRMNSCILREIGSMRLVDIKPLHCQRVLNMQAGKSKRHINEIYQIMQFLFRHAVANSLMPTNPAEHITKPHGTASHRRALTASERRVFINVGLRDRRYILYMLMLFCGCRTGEAANAMGKDIMILSNGRPALHIRGTKNTNADRLVPIPAALYEVIRDTPPNEYIAQTEKGNRITENYRIRLWKSFCRQLNIEMGCKVYRNALVPPYPLAPDLVPYCLRHEFCTDLARRGVDVRIAQKLMGHSDIKLTANIYTNLNKDDITEISDMLAEGDAVGDAPKCVKMHQNAHLSTAK